MAFFSWETKGFARPVAVVYTVAVLYLAIFFLFLLCLPSYALWLGPAIFFAAVVHWLDLLPYQHHWNPSIRDLYPYRQYWPERKAMALLHRANVFHSHRWRKRVQLPPELWVQIILWTIDSPYHFATLCEPKDFHLFVYAHSSRELGLWDYQRVSKRKKELRLVSHLWAETLDRHSQWVVMRGRPEPRQLHPHRDVRRVDFHLKSQESHLDPSTPATVQDELHLSIPLSKLSIVSLCTSSNTRVEVYTSSNSHTEVYTQLCSSVYTHAARFRSARGFILDASRGHVASKALSGIEKSFSRITSLTLIAREITGALSLEYLEILILSTGRAETQGWNMPRLAHLALGTSRLDNLMYTTALFPGASLRLRSLHLRPAQVLDTTEKFWVEHPLLEYLGITSSRFQLTDPPPSDHPLAHIYFWDSIFSIELMDIRHVTAICASIPQLRTVVVPDKYFKANDDHLGAWVKLARAVKRRGVRWIGPYGDEIDNLDFLLTPSVKKERDWE